MTSTSDLYACTSDNTRTSISGFSPAAVMDPEGDVVLIVPSNEGEAQFQINSNILCVASPVFRAMIGRHSQFKEARVLASKDQVPLELTLQDDNPNALAVVLRVIHMKQMLVPKNLDEDQLYKVAVICDKYDMSSALVLWTDRWIPLLVPNEAARPPTVIGHKWLFIAYVFGRKELFHQLSHEIILTATTTHDEFPTLIMNAKDGTGRNDYIPDSILAEIATCRQQCIERMIDSVHQMIDQYSNPESGSLKCKNTRTEEACDSLILGFLIRAFKLKHVYPIASSEVMHESVRNLLNILIDMKFPGNAYCADNRYCAYCESRYTRTQELRNSDGYCEYCRSYDMTLRANLNHSTSCSPVADFIKNVRKVYNKVAGLNLETFIREGEAKVAVVEDGKALWDYVQYK